MQNRYDFVYLFDVKDGNPNGDPDAGNLPRTDPETGQGLVTDVCLKRKIRNYVGLVKGEQPPFEIYVKEKAVLNRLHDRAYKHYELKPTPKKLPKEEEDARKLTALDVRQLLRHPHLRRRHDNGSQLRPGAGTDPVRLRAQHRPYRHPGALVTRCAVTNEKEPGKGAHDGRKFTVPYALYRVHGFINPHLADQTGFDANGDDLALFVKALEQMFETDRSAARGEMTARRLILFKHASKLGNAPAHQLFGRVQVLRKRENQRSEDQSGDAGQESRAAAASTRTIR